MKCKWEIPVLDYVSFEIGSGKIVGLLGPNGAGKTISMIILTGYLAYESGEVEMAKLKFCIGGNLLDSK